jgi:hypothetical protein
MILLVSAVALSVDRTSWIFSRRSFGVRQVALLFALRQPAGYRRSSSRPVCSRHPVCAVSSLAVRDVNGERFRFQVGIRRCSFNFSQGNRRQVNVRIAALAVNGNSTGYIGNFTEEINLAAANIGISCIRRSHTKNAVAIAAERRTFFIAISLSE